MLTRRRFLSWSGLGVLSLSTGCRPPTLVDSAYGAAPSVPLVQRKARLRDLTKTHGLVTLLADLRVRPRRTLDRFSTLLDDRAHEVVTLERRSRRSLRVRRRDGATATLA